MLCHTYHCIHRPVHHASIQFDDLLNRIKLLEADRLGSYLGRRVKPLLDTIDKASGSVESVDCYHCMQCIKLEGATG